MTDPLGKADEFAAREEAAGGPDKLVSSLVTGIEHLRFVTRVLAVSLVLDICLTIGFGALYFRGHSADQNIANNTAQITKDRRADAILGWSNCERSRKNSINLNKKNAALVTFLKSLPNQTPTLLKFTELSSTVLIVPVCGTKPK